MGFSAYDLGWHTWLKKFYQKFYLDLMFRESHKCLYLGKKPSGTSKNSMDRDRCSILLSYGDRVFCLRRGEVEARIAG